jgi:hypothetical protein
MNSLSWFLYWIDVLNSMSNILTIISILLIAAIIALWVACSFRLESGGCEDKDLVRSSRSKWTWRFSMLSLFCAFTACFMPSKSTMYAIAASQVGERVAQSEAVQGIANDATKALQIWIKKQIEPEHKS